MVQNVQCQQAVKVFTFAASTWHHAHGCSPACTPVDLTYHKAPPVNNIHVTESFIHSTHKVLVPRNSLVINHTPDKHKTKIQLVFKTIMHDLGRQDKEEEFTNQTQMFLTHTHTVFG